MLLDGSLVISEFMAINDSVVADEDGVFSDWIEVHNPTAEAIDLDGWYLTDRADELARWRFPDLTLPAGDYLLVFASGNDRRVAGSELHTDFRLDGDGEYLALVDPDGVTVVHEFAPTYPPQVADVAYGLDVVESPTTLLAAPSAAEVLIPTDDSLGTTWTEAAFVAGPEWDTAAATGVGFDADGDFDALIGTDVEAAMLGVNSSAFIRVPFDVADADAVDTLLLSMQYDDGFVAHLNGTQVTRRNAPSLGDADAIAVPLGNLFDDAKGTALTDAIASDTYQAEGDTSDLGVATVIDGSLHLVQEIAPNIMFDTATAGGGSTAVNGKPANDTYRSVAPQAIRTTGSNTPAVPSAKVEDGVGMHANELISFDLDELRDAGGFAAAASYFTAKAGINDTSAPSNGNLHAAAIVSDDAGNVLAGYVNGHQVAVSESAGVWSFSGALPSSLSGSGNSRFAQFAFWMPENARYLTLVAAANGADASDHAVFSGATVEMTAIPLSNLFDDAKGTPLATAIATDTHQAAGETSDLGVAVQFGGGLNAPQTIAPGVTMNLQNVGGNGGDAGGGPANDTWRSASDQPIRTRGVGFSGLNGDRVEDGIGMHADDLITFDLEELRADGAVGAGTEFVFRARAGINDEQIGVGSPSVRAIAVVSDAAGNVLSGYVNGQLLPVIDTAGEWTFDVSGGTPGQLVNNGQFAEFDVPLAPDAAYLTLAMTGGTSVNNDHGVFSGARLLVVPQQGDDPFNAAATVDRDDTAALTAEEIDLTDHVDLLHDGTNVLAIQGLNHTAGSDDFLIVPELIGGEVVVTPGTVRYFTAPTPGAANDPSPGDVAPLIVDAAHAPVAPTDADDIFVTARVVPTQFPVDQVTLHWRVMYGAETAVTMIDDGSIGGDTAGDGIFTALIPATASGDGDMVRWRITAADTDAASSRLPAFDSPTKSPEYLGTMVADASVDSQLPVIYWFTQDEAAATGGGTRGSVFFNGEFYDNIFMRRRGQSSNGGPKKNVKFDFNPGFGFRFDPDLPRVGEINLNNAWYDKAYVRAPLSWEAFRDAGATHSISFPVRTQLNGAFWSVSIFVEQPEDEYLERNGLDPNGALYKVTGNNTLVSLSGIEKKTRKDEDFSDLQALIDGVDPALPQAQRATYLYDNVNLPAVINYIAVQSIIHNNDHVHKNNYLYRDTEGNGEWEFLPWDLDLTLGKNFANLGDEIHVDELPGGHPLFGNSDYPRGGVADLWNKLIDAVLDTPELQEMYLRRLRTLMDDLLQPPGTPQEELLFEARLDELFDQMESDIVLDDAKWAEEWGIDFTFQENIDRIKNLYLAVRRTHLFETHSIDNVPTLGETLVGAGAEVRWLAPTDDSLAGQWNLPGFDDATWTVGATGVGYENNDTPENPTNYAPLIAPTGDVGAAMFGQHTSIYMRMTFDLADQAAVDAIENLILHAKYDDGLVAYLNGQEIGRGNFTGTPTYDATAPNREETLNNQFETIPLTAAGDQLMVGQNVLAIHGFNQSASSSDLLFLPELLVGTPGEPTAAGIPHAQVGNPAIQFGQVEANPISGNQDEEYIELFNPNDTAVDISGWRLTGGVEHTFQPGVVIAAGGTLYVSPDVVAFRARTAGPGGEQDLFVQGNYSGHISNLGEQIDLVAGDESVVATVVTPFIPSDAQRYLRISEIMYHPGDPTVDEQLAGFLDAEDFEFVELVNTSDTVTLDLTGVAFTQGIQYAFPASTMLAPEERILVVRNAAAFAQRYDTTGLNIAGEYRDPIDDGNKLSNGGETLKLEDADNSTIQQFAYNDSVNQGWPTTPDGQGHSLEAVSSDDGNGDPAAWNDYGESAMWYASVEDGGTPGAAATAAVLERDVFYDGSAFDTIDDDAIAPDKIALRPGQTATAVNYTNFDRGINGVIVDIAWPASAALLTDGDFTFMAGNDDDPSSWTAAATPDVTVVEGAGRGGSDRVYLSWPTGAPTNTWLQVTARSDVPNTGLTADDVFFFGNAVGETGNDPANALTTAADLIAIRNNVRGDGNRADLTNPHDVNRDRLVDATDALLARNAVTGPFDALRLISPPLPDPPPSAEGEAASRASDGPGISRTHLFANQTEGGCKHPSYALDGALIAWLRDSLVSRR